jgi:dTDP-6-deoxy-L-talose 4-dehydrogenase (NAD+)
MRVLVTGATGFVGRHVVSCLLSNGHVVVVVVRNIDNFYAMPWAHRVECIVCDLHKDLSPVFDIQRLPDTLIHLAWPGLPNFNSYFHIEKNLSADFKFLHKAIKCGVKHLMVAGTCLEYGLQSGPLSEEAETKPTTAYGLAKDTLRKSLQLLQKETPFLLQWLRLFYMYGPGQNPRSLISQLDEAIDKREPVFNMSEGSQLRDYLPIETVGSLFTQLLEDPSVHGVINCSSGRPVSISELVRMRCAERNSEILLNKGFYDYPDYEPFAFWGVSNKLPR